MPIIKSAVKKLRKDKKRTKINLKYEKQYKRLLKQVKKTKNKDLLKLAYSKIDKAAKRKVIHKNKAARLKSRLSKFLNKNKIK